MQTEANVESHTTYREAFTTNASFNDRIRAKFTLLTKPRIISDFPRCN